MIDEQARSMVRSKNEKNIVGKFARYSEIMSYIDTVVQDNPDIASSYNPGNSFENRQLKTIVLKAATGKKGIWIGINFVIS